MRFSFNRQGFGPRVFRDPLIRAAITVIGGVGELSSCLREKRAVCQCQHGLFVSAVNWAGFLPPPPSPLLPSTLSLLTGVCHAAERTARPRIKSLFIVIIPPRHLALAASLVCVLRRGNQSSLIDLSLSLSHGQDRNNRTKQPTMRFGPTLLLSATAAAAAANCGEGDTRSVVSHAAEIVDVLVQQQYVLSES